MRSVAVAAAVEEVLDRLGGMLRMMRAGWIPAMSIRYNDELMQIRFSVSD